MRKIIGDWLQVLRNLYFKKKVGSCGKGCIFYGKIGGVSSWKGIHIGNNTILNNNVLLMCRNNGSQIIIGDNTTISNGAVILTSGYDMSLFMQGERVHTDKTVTIIGNNVWLCARVIICGGKNYWSSCCCCNWFGCNKRYFRKLLLVWRTTSKIIKDIQVQWRIA